ncbi:hypothetical protein G9A89_011554, partial [Geosiphon pyriformis]
MDNNENGKAFSSYPSSRQGTVTTTPISSPVIRPISKSPIPYEDNQFRATQKSLSSYKLPRREWSFDRYVTVDMKEGLQPKDDPDFTDINLSEDKGYKSRRRTWYNVLNWIFWANLNFAILLGSCVLIKFSFDGLAPLPWVKWPFLIYIGLEIFVRLGQMGKIYYLAQGRMNCTQILLFPLLGKEAYFLFGFSPVTTKEARDRSSFLLLRVLYHWCACEGCENDNGDCCRCCFGESRSSAKSDPTTNVNK